jgi:hypothetical protein
MTFFESIEFGHPAPFDAERAGFATTQYPGAGRDPSSEDFGSARFSRAVQMYGSRLAG